MLQAHRHSCLCSGHVFHNGWPGRKAGPSLVGFIVLCEMGTDSKLFYEIFTLPLVSCRVQILLCRVATLSRCAKVQEDISDPILIRFSVGIYTALLVNVTLLLCVKIRKRSWLAAPLGLLHVAFYKDKFEV